MTARKPALEAARSNKKHCNGEKGAMAGHLRRCALATAEEKSLASRVAPTQREKKEAKAEEKRKRDEGDDGTDADNEGAGVLKMDQSKKKKRKRVLAVETSFSQSKLQVFRGNDIPFSKDHQDAIARQTLRATQSANLPERWTEDIEVMKLFIMMRSRAMDAIPSRSQLGGSLLRDAAKEIDAQTKAQVSGKEVLMCTDGWRSNRKDAVGGVTLNVQFKSHLVDVMRTNQWGKDGESMKLHFTAMIEKAEKDLGCIVIGFLTDNDGGSKKGRLLLAIAKPYLFTFPCCAHQGQLILGDYLKENEAAAILLGELIDVVNWINSHDKVRDIFDKEQEKANGKVLAYILPNLTRWTTHLIAAVQFEFLKAPIRAAILSRRDDIVAAQVGAETNTRKRLALEEDAISHCEMIESNGWWDRLKRSVIPDMEHICYLTNISQSDHVRPDQFLLALAATNRTLGKNMCARIEKRFKELDQPVFVFALILNPFERLERFGDDAKVDVFKLSTELVALYRRYKSRPPLHPRNEEQQLLFAAGLNSEAQRLNTAFMQYLSGTGLFASWFEDESPHQNSYTDINGVDPLPFWTMMRLNSEAKELSDFATTLLRLVVNQAGLERWFSDFANKKNKKRNRLGLTKMAQQAKLTRQIRTEQVAEGLIDVRGGRKNHSNARVLLSVPRYADAILSDTDDSDVDGGRLSVVVRSKAAWRKQLGEWQAEMHELDQVSDSRDTDIDQPLPGIPTPNRPRAQRSWLPSTLASLFGGVVSKPIVLGRRTRVVSEEALYMELLEADRSDEEPDAGAQEGSGDDFMP
ncbi:unnamed protein product [Mycena citricolor]|uniref:DUF659 domain-containing protein n=1 Tax=Mycena citricolor TaxID=2018698 RepID=A0AAD2HK69_9AGAR|nr:unnamed protein product [Mycena citricolor]